MIPCLKEIDTGIFHEIHNTVFLSEPSRPHTGAEIFQRLRLSDAAERIAENRLDESKCTESSLAVGLDPVLQVFSEFRMKDCVAGGFYGELILFRQTRSPVSGPRQIGWVPFRLARGSVR